MSKPGEFMIGVVDFFAVVLPGMLATWMLISYLPPDMARYLDLGAPGEDPDRSLRWAAFLLGSYVLGNFVFMLGAKLDASYDRWRWRTKPTDRDRAFQAAKRLLEELTPALKGGEFTTLKWAKSYIQIHSPGARAEIDLLEAHSKFFRSLVIVAAALAAHFLLREGSLYLSLGAATLAALSYRRYLDRRWAATELSYGTVVVLHSTRSPEK